MEYMLYPSLPSTVIDFYPYVDGKADYSIKSKREVYQAFQNPDRAILVSFLKDSYFPRAELFLNCDLM